MNKNYQDINSETIDRWIVEGWEWGIPVNHEQFVSAKKGIYNILLTPTKNIPKFWIGDVNGKKVLGLASGGGQQMPILAALGAKCTVLDYSQKQIDSEIMVAKRENYKIKTVRADMTKQLPFSDEEFDLIIHPVSNCYVKEVVPIFEECYRVLKRGGKLLAGFSNEINYLLDTDEIKIINKMPFDPLKNSEQMDQLKNEDCGIQFSHTLEENIGGQLSAGFTIKDIYEDTNGEGRLQDLNIKTYYATLAEK